MTNTKTTTKPKEPAGYKYLSITRPDRVLIIATVVGILNLITIHIIARALHHVIVAIPYISMTENHRPEHYITSIVFTSVAVVLCWTQYLVYVRQRTLYPQNKKLLMWLFFNAIVSSIGLFGQAVFELQLDWNTKKYNSEEAQELKNNITWHSNIHLTLANCLFISTMIHTLSYLVFMVKNKLHKEKETKGSFKLKIFVLSLLVLSFVMQQILQNIYFPKDQEQKRITTMQFGAVFQYLMVISIMAHYTSFYKELKRVHVFSYYSLCESESNLQDPKSSQDSIPNNLQINSENEYLVHQSPNNSSDDEKL
ncbi:fasting-inducible integral membrane protein tm6p1-related [Anaeramoeba flamelloides]|uniref:Fasting-inducible integral membrane protein tm6p1-related n=1 Tax=Anaeramoeba flamelloides TaxID=1746091 RepID=A0ABQ8XSW8_9EUKA|nr:fasting-inducible integral membrane protein tm6p1-related [Anaeramoeba flamelloides]